MNSPSRNEKCSCGSGKKYKKCCGAKKSLAQRTATVLPSGKSDIFIQRVAQFGQQDSARKEEAKPLDSATAISNPAQ